MYKVFIMYLWKKNTNIIFIKIHSFYHRKKVVARHIMTSGHKHQFSLLQSEQRWYDPLPDLGLVLTLNSHDFFYLPVSWHTHTYNSAFTMQTRTMPGKRWRKKEGRDLGLGMTNMEQRNHSNLNCFSKDSSVREKYINFLKPHILEASCVAA